MEMTKHCSRIVGKIGQLFKGIPYKRKYEKIEDILEHEYNIMVCHKELIVDTVYDDDNKLTYIRTSILRRVKLDKSIVKLNYTLADNLAMYYWIKSQDNRFYLIEYIDTIDLWEMSFIRWLEEIPEWSLDEVLRYRSEE
ncbi:MAG: hypothetical protein JNL32_01600 [Candidatus Kapabacteria bacterium]|nr:hypothetical protein [Candidatus Kapabacteria bacterium]